MSKSFAARNSSSAANNNAASSESPAPKKQQFTPVSVLKCKGFINSLTRVARNPQENEGPLFFARIAIVTGREMHNDSYRDRMQFVDVLIGSSSLQRIADNSIGSNDDRIDSKTQGFPFAEVLCHFEIHDLHFSIFENAKEGAKTSSLNTKGILAELSFS